MTGRARGTVRAWHDAEGWGVVDAQETPGGCWVHYGMLRTAGEPAPGEAVTFTHEVADQDGYAFRALEVWVDGAEPSEPSEPVSGSAAYTSSLEIELD